MWMAWVLWVRGFEGGVIQILEWFPWVHKIFGRGQDFSVGETYDFMNFYYDSMSFTCGSNLFCIVMNFLNVVNLLYFVLIHIQLLSWTTLALTSQGKQHRSPPIVTHILYFHRGLYFPVTQSFCSRLQTTFWYFLYFFLKNTLI